MKIPRSWSVLHIWISGTLKKERSSPLFFKSFYSITFWFNYTFCSVTACWRDDDFGISTQWPLVKSQRARRHGPRSEENPWPSNQRTLSVEGKVATGRHSFFGAVPRRRSRCCRRCFSVSEPRRHQGRDLSLLNKKVFGPEFCPHRVFFPEWWSKGRTTPIHDWRQFFYWTHDNVTAARVTCGFVPLE